MTPVGAARLSADPPALPTAERELAPPRTRYQGSKYKLLPWLWHHMADLPFTSVLDAFGGTGSVSYMLKLHGKSVTYNDYLRSNYHIGRALIANPGVRFPDQLIGAIDSRSPTHAYASLIFENYHDIYFTDSENAWLDIAVQNIRAFDNPWHCSLAYYALFQAWIVKRPYNLFHRKNLYMRTAHVKRSFGNKATWDKPFPDHLRSFVRTLNGSTFASPAPCTATCCDARRVPGDFDLVYIDSPYINAKGTGVDYFAFYHFLEGLSEYDDWHRRIDWRKKHRPMAGPVSPWSDRRTDSSRVRQLFEPYADSIIVVSYRSDGIPSLTDLTQLLREFKTDVRVHRAGSYQYALSTNRQSEEIVIVAR